MAATVNERLAETHRLMVAAGLATDEPLPDDEPEPDALDGSDDWEAWADR